MIKKQFLKSFMLGALFFSKSSLAVDNISNYYKEVYLGEKKTQNYFGPLDPRAEFSAGDSTLRLLDEIYYEQFFNKQIQEEPFGLHNYWFDEVVEKSTCPDDELAEHLEYIRYLYRLVSMSYLYESIKLNYKTSFQMGLKNNCSIHFDYMLSKCSPQTQDMKKFHSRVHGKFKNEIEKEKFQSMAPSEKEKLLSSFKKSNSLTSNPVFSRLHQWCQSNKKNCKNLTEAEMSSALGSFCDKDREVLQFTCSEEDSLYGISQTSIPTELIQNSNAFGLINKTGKGQECLRRFGKLFKAKEMPYRSLNAQFPLMYSYLLENKSRYIQGELFLPGALKEFDMKGLSDFLSALTPPKKTVVIKQKPKVVAKPAPKVVEVIIPKVEEPIVPKVEVKVEPVVVLSEFESKAKDFKVKGGPIDLDMDKFNKDFSFTEEMIASISGPIQKFQTRTALLEMKAYDSLGSMGAPVGLIFLKYLIDTNNHQGLYNIVNVLGEKFYVSNDIEEKDQWYLIELKNNEKTGNRWQITLINK